MADRTSYRFVLRGNTAAGAAASDLPMLEKEIGYETDTGRSKVGLPGDATKYRDIPHYFTPGSYKLDGLAHGQGFKWDATLGLMVPTELGKTYQPGTGISIDNPTSATPTINSTLGSIALSGRKEDYAHLPASGNAPGDAYLLDSDGLVYVWDGAWPAEGAGVRVGSQSAPDYGRDPLWDRVVMYVGAGLQQGQAQFSDFTGRSWILGAYGAPVFSDSAHPLLGEPSIRFTGSSTSNLFTPSSPNLSLGSNDFTIETTFSFTSSQTSSSGFPGVITKRSGGDEWGIYYHQDIGGMRFLYKDASGVKTLDSALKPTAGASHHIAAFRVGSTIYLAIDGSVVKSAAISGAIPSNGQPIYLGTMAGGAFYFDGNILAARITAGASRYSAAGFTAPPSPFPTHA